MRIGVYGGSFDPPHIGHRVLAVDASESLKLDRLFVIPTGSQPLKSDKKDGASPEQRLAMTKLAFAGAEFVEVDESEVNRDGLSFTVDTLDLYAKRHPDAEIFLILGRDSYENLHRWKNPDRIRQLSTVALLDRNTLSAGPIAGVRIVATRRIDVSSSEIRARRKAGKSIAGFVADSVRNYIETNNLYASSGASQD